MLGSVEWRAENADVRAAGVAFEFQATFAPTNTRTDAITVVAAAPLTA